jgi:hypothetical protein
MMSFVGMWESRRLFQRIVSDFVAYGNGFVRCERIVSRFVPFFFLEILPFDVVLLHLLVQITPVDPRHPGGLRHIAPGPLQHRLNIHPLHPRLSLLPHQPKQLVDSLLHTWGKIVYNFLVVRDQRCCRGGLGVMGWDGGGWGSVFYSQLKSKFRGQPNICDPTQRYCKIRPLICQSTCFLLLFLIHCF